MALVDGDFYVANTDAVVRFPYQPGVTRIDTPPVKLVDLPAGPINHHWTKSLIASVDGAKLYATVGSNSNVGERGIEVEGMRAAIWEIDRKTGAHRVFASGLRNPNGMDWLPGTNTLWTVVNERDMLGDDLVPDFLTSVREGAFYGWPYAYFGQHEDPRQKGKRPELVAKAVVPDLAVGAHTATLGLAFYRGSAFPARFRGGAFIGQHGSWNRSAFSGYRVAFIPFANGRPAGPPEDFLTGFVASEIRGEVYGRPVGVAALRDGSIVVADDAGGRVWRVRHGG
jgi:glucose/arabinose dehydrogenase